VLRIELAPEVFRDFDRFLDHLAKFGVADEQGRIDDILQALEVLTHSPLLGRPVKDGKRELVIGQRGHGYVALYRYFPNIETVFILAITSQRESGYTR
jgi:toxin ParE1/3/4